jgi:hypothetical protein
MTPAYASIRGPARCARMEDSPLVVALKWIATGTGVTAAFIVSMDLGRRATGAGFVIFVVSSIAWIAGAVLTEDWALTTQNGVMFAINIFGVYRYLVRKRPNG